MIPRPAPIRDTVIAATALNDPSTAAKRSGATRSAQARERVTKEVAEIRARLLEWLNDSDAPGRALHFSERDARQALGVSLYKLTRACEELATEGVLVPLNERASAGDRRRRHRGWGLRGAIPPRRTLAELLQCVAAAPKPVVAPGCGPKSAAEEAAPLTALSDSQRKDLLSVGNLIAENAPRAAGDHSRVTADYLARVVETEQGRRPWALEGEVQEWVNMRARKRLKPGMPWSPTDNSAARQKAKSSVKTLLHFARSIGWLEAGQSRGTDAIHTYAPEWHPLIHRWRARLTRREQGANEPSIRMGLQILALYATRHGFTDPRTTEWCDVLDEIESDFQAKALLLFRRQAARWVWRKIHLLQRLRRLETMQEERVALVPQRAVKRVLESVASATREDDLDFGGWVNADGLSLCGLVEGPYGLRRLTWFTAGSDIGVAGDSSLPRRAYESTYKRRPKRVAIEEITLESRLESIAYLAGWAVRHDGAVFSLPTEDEAIGRDAISGGTSRKHDTREATDQRRLGQDSLLSLMEGERLVRYLNWRKSREDTAPAVGGAHVRNLLGTLRRAAQDIRLLAAHKRDEATALCIAELVESINRQAMVANVRSEEEHFRDCVAINEAWRAGSDRRYGLEKLVQLRDLLVEDACQAASLTVEEQLAALRKHREHLAALRLKRIKTYREDEAEQRARIDFTMNNPWRSQSWAIALRRAWLAQFVRKIPLRDYALRHLSRAMLIATKDGKPCDPWVEGATVLIVVGPKYTKNGKKYEAAYVAQDMANLPAHEEGAARYLLELIFAPGGALDWFCEQAPKGVACDFLFPINANKGVKGHGERAPRKSLRMTSGGLTSEWRAMVTRHGPALGVDVGRLRAIHGGLGIHSVRYLFGRFWAAVQNKLVYASEMLHHNDLDLTIRRYVGRSNTTVSHDVVATASDVKSTVPSSFSDSDAVVTLIASQAREIDALRQQLAARGS